MQTVQDNVPDSRISHDTASGKIAANWEKNEKALAISQPECAHAMSVVEGVTWLFARDGSLTAMLPGERWWAGCSVPLAAARFMLKKMEAGGNVACFLSPDHAAQLRVALDKLQ